ncbi:unnamed protein product [Moneuplotes crassus]|uniref:Poly(A) RNA polymerase mitochondrial-like central palm domain-containing protein n=2 Tax=Euplotes crassus TaxID=5936 RepID=A0AAD2D7V9_EUPCR|nr:unnamed protein product [Moneuplotes crassus]
MIYHYIIDLEYILSVNHNKTIEEIYNKTKGDKSPFDLKQTREYFVHDMVKTKEVHDEEPENIKLAQKVTRILLDITHSFGYTNAKAVEKEANTFWNIAAKGDPAKIANAFENVVEFLITAKIKLSEEDIEYLNSEVIEGYLAPKLLALDQLEEKKVEIYEESKYEHPPTQADHLAKIKEKFSGISAKKSKEDILEEGKFTLPNEEELETLIKKVHEVMEEPENLKLLEYHISDIYTSSQVAASDYQNCAYIISHIQELLRNSEFIKEKFGLATVENYGSSANTLWSMDSDIDIAVHFTPNESMNSKKKAKGNKKESKKKQNVVNEMKKIDYIKALVDIRKVIRGMAANGDIEGIFGARIPLIKFTDKSTGIECDLSINNTNGIPNSRLTRIYCEFDQRVHIMVKYIRHIFKESGLLQGDQGCLNSYSIVLMVIAFCQSQEDPILPNLQEGAKDNDLIFYTTTKNRYGRAQVKEVKYSLNEDFETFKKEFGFKNKKTVAQLVAEFLIDFFLKGDIIKTHQIDIKKGGFFEGPTDMYSYIDIVEPLTPDAKVGQGCRKDSHHPQAYTQFVYSFLQNVVEFSK